MCLLFECRRAGEGGQSWRRARFLKKKYNKHPVSGVYNIVKAVRGVCACCFEDFSLVFRKYFRMIVIKKRGMEAGLRDDLKAMRF
jgi:hypothetical protein